jgi:hypothetical protein
MESYEIIKNIDFVYKKFRTPFHLQEHMRSAAAVAKFICEHWKGGGINCDDVVAEHINS